ncbi:MAG: glycosyltransferase [Chloroflexi bacterium]|nr:glycosyltransferase [Chloroflexota bacterium]
MNARRHDATARRADCVSVVLPCLNEAATIGPSVAKALRGIERSGRSGEVVVADNGSSDGSDAIAEGAGARVVRAPVRGYGAALRRGFEAAQHDIVVMADADDTYDLENLAAVVAPVASGADLVLANRFANISDGAMPWLHRRVGTPAINLLLRLAYGVRVGDSQSGYRAIRRSKLEQLDLRSDGMELASEMLIKASRIGLHIGEAPSSYSVRRGESKLRSLRDGWRHLRLILLLAPTLVFLIPGVCLMLLGLLTFAVGFGLGGAIEVGTLRWQPVFAGPIFVVLGASALEMWLIGRARLVGRGLASPWKRFAWTQHPRWLEMSVVGGCLMALGGIVIDLYLFNQWVSASGTLSLAPQLAALAQTLIIVGANIVLLGILSASSDV